VEPTWEKGELSDIRLVNTLAHHIESFIGDVQCSWTVGFVV
jgi:hypothetical protein